MIGRFERLHPPAPRRLTAAERLWLRIAEGLMTIAVAIFATSLEPIGTFVVGMGYVLVLLELARWEQAGG